VKTKTPTPAQSDAARKAWATRRARAAAAMMVTTTALTPASARAAVLPEKPAIVNVSTSETFAPVRVYQRPVLEPVTEFRMVEMWVDTAEIGCGLFRFIVLAVSSIEVKLFQCSKLTAIVVPRADFDRLHVPALKVKRAVLADIIRRNVRIADKINDNAMRPVVTDGGTDAVQALELLAAR
jgi:hypothetical protein